MGSAHHNVYSCHDQRARGYLHMGWPEFRQLEHHHKLESRRRSRTTLAITIHIGAGNTVTYDVGDNFPRWCHSQSGW